MKFFILMCCIAHLLTGISSRLRRTTPMTSALRSDDAEERQVAQFAEIIDFVNSVPDNNDRRSSFRRHVPLKRLDSRRLNEVMAAMYGFAELKEFENVDNFDVVEEKVRRDIIDDSDFLMEHRVRRKKSNTEEIIDKEDTPFDTSKYSTAKLKNIDATTEVTDANPNVTLHVNVSVTSRDNATVYVKAQDDVLELITDETIYRRRFTDDEDDSKPSTERNKLTNNEKRNSTPKATEEDHDTSAALYKTDQFEKKSQSNKPSRKEDKAQIDKKKADKHISKETVTNKEDNKEYRSTNFIYSQEKLNEDSIRPKDEPDDEIINKEDHDTNENSQKDKKQKDKSWDKNENNLTSAEILMVKVDNKTHNNRDQKEEYSINSNKERSENSSSKHSKKRYEKIDKYDKKIKDKYTDIRGERGSQWIKVDTQMDYVESLRDRKKDKWSEKERDLVDKDNDEWSKKEKENVKNDDRLSKKDWDNDDTWNKKEKDWNKNDDKLSKNQKHWDQDDRWTKKEKDWDNDDRWIKKEKDWDNYDRSSKKEKPRDKDDERWTVKEKYWNNKKRDNYKDKDFDIMEYEWNKRHQDNDAIFDHNDDETYEKDFKERDNYYKKRDRELNQKYDWTKRGSEHENHDRIYDRNESGNKKSYESVGQDRNVRHDRYKVVDRADSGSSRNDDYERFI